VPTVRRWHDEAVHSGSPDGNPSLWRRVDALIDRAPSEDDLRSHRLEVLAARRFRAVGRPVPEDFAAMERFAAVAFLTAPIVLERVRAAYDGPVIVLKGPEVAARYPDPAMRGFGDLDVLVRSAEEAQHALLAAGFELVGSPELYVGIHHLRPVLAPGMPLPVEVHSRPKWLAHGSPPSLEELFEASTVGASGVEGISALPAEHHALLLAVHSWAHEPLRRIRDVIDVAAMIENADLSGIDRLARSWGVHRVWKATLRAADAVLADGRSPATLHLWAQNLKTVRERTVLEGHLERWLSDFWAMTFPAALARVPLTFGGEVFPGDDEGWRHKLARSALAVRHAAHRRSHHDQRVDERLSLQSRERERDKASRRY
jgi:hypothetical protein